MIIRVLCHRFSLFTIWYGVLSVACQDYHQESSSTRRTIAVRSSSQQSMQIGRVNYDAWAKTLSLVVQGDQVNYQALNQGEARKALDLYLRSIQDPITDQLSRQARFAFWINAYNAITLRHVINYPGLKSVATAIPSAPRYQFFKQRRYKVDGQLVSLDDIEHTILRPQFTDPRVHFAINCASQSCPTLHLTPYRAHKLEQQLQDAVQRFLNDSSRNQFSVEQFNLSKIFSWFEKDFAAPINPTQPQIDHHGIRTFLAKHLKGEQRKWALIAPIHFLPYDWALNGQAP